MILFAVLDTSKDGPPRFAGVVNYWLANLRTLSVELGSVMTTLAYRRTHVTTHAAGLLIAYALTPPSVKSTLLAGEGGLGLRRIQWTAYPYNEASIRCALRLGFSAEGVLRNAYEKPSDPRKGKHDEGNADLERGRELPMEPCYDEGGDRTERGYAQDCWLASITCRDWDEGVEDRLAAQMSRDK
jgi:RimJ/RimL family protein N-acetyltransferase